MKIQTVCRDCNDRQVGCHGNCERYIRSKREFEDQKDELRKIKEHEDAYYLYIKQKRSMRYK